MAGIFLAFNSYDANSYNVEDSPEKVPYSQLSEMCNSPGRYLHYSFEKTINGIKMSDVIFDNLCKAREILNSIPDSRPLKNKPSYFEESYTEKRRCS